jgi:glycosyl transferase, family 25
MRVLLINLDRSPERLAAFRREAARCGLDFQRLSAIDGRSLKAANLAALIDPHFRFQPMGAGEVAIFLSHREAWRIAAKGPDRWTAVMEDDVRLADDLPALLEAIEEIDPDAGIIRLETMLRRVVLDDEAIALTPGRALHRMRSWHGGTAAYAIHHNAAADLIIRSEKLSDPLDQWLFNPLSPVFDALHVGQVVPGAAIQAAQHDRATAGAAAASTSGRKRADAHRLVPRHGVVIDVRRWAWKLVERGKRLADRCRRGRSYRFIPFVRSADSRVQPAGKRSFSS